MAIQHDDLEIVAACRDPAKLLPAYKGEVRVGDLRDASYLDRLLVNIDIVVHTAGWTSFAYDTKKSSQLYLEPTIELINHAIEWRVSRFVNTSSLVCAPLKQRHNPASPGLPRSYWPMINCLIAVEDYMQAHAKIGCTMVNLRLGMYSGHRMNTGLLPLCLDRLKTQSISYASDSASHFPLIDGLDIGQAFARAALAPSLTNFEAFNITGPDQPSASDVFHFLQQQRPSLKTAYALPPLLSHFHARWLEFNKTPQGESRFTRSLTELFKHPEFSNELAKDKLGYDPEISWQASLHKLLGDEKKITHAPLLSSASKTLNLNE